MSEIYFAGPVGRIEGRFHMSTLKNAPAVLLLHPDPLQGGTMNNKVVYNMFKVFVKTGFTALRINFPGVGKSEGQIGNGVNEFRVASCALDWLQHKNPEASHFWVAGFSFGSFIAMQLATRRPEIENFVIAAPPTPKYDFSVSIPCPASGLVIQGDIDERSAVDNVTNLVKEWRQQKNYTIEYEIVHSANHFFEDKIEEMSAVAEEYINTSLAIRVAKPVKKKRRRRKKKDRRYEGEE